MATPLHHQFDVSLILACYNEAEHFRTSIKEIMTVLDKTDWNYEIIFVDDHSQDNTRRLIQEILKNYPSKHVSAYYHQKNQGRGATVADGFLKAKGKIVGYIDFDLEVPAWYMPRFIESVEQGNEVVTALRIYDISISRIHRWLASKGYAMVRNWVLHTQTKDTEAGYKFFKRSVALKLIKKCSDPGWFWDTEILVIAERLGYKIAELPVVFIRRLDKTSTVRFIPDTVRYIKSLISFKRK